MLRRLDETIVGIPLLGMAALAYGIACFLQRDFAIFWQPVPQGLPMRHLFAFLSSGLLVVGGIGLLAERTVRPAAMLLMTLFGLYGLCYVIILFGPPINLSGLMGFAEQLAVVLGALAILVRLAPRRSSEIVILRVLVGVCSLVFGLAHFVGRVPTSNMVPEWMPGGQMFWALATGVGHFAIGFALISNRLAVSATRWGSLMYICFVLLAWLPGAFGHPTEWLRWAGAAFSLCMTGALWATGDLLVVSKKKNGWISGRADDAAHEAWVTG